MIRAALVAAIVLFIAKPYLFPQVIEGVARFKDGDSGFVGETRVRLWSVDTPEFDTSEGRRAAEFAWAEINGQVLRCKRRQRSLSYGRVVVSCVFWTGEHFGKSVAQVLIDNRHAIIQHALYAK